MIEQMKEMMPASFLLPSPKKDFHASLSVARTLLLSAGLLLGTLSSTWALPTQLPSGISDAAAVTVPSAAVSTESSSPEQLMLPTSIPQVPSRIQLKLRAKQKLNKLYALDKAPSAHRIPLIIIPGRAQEFQPDPWWKRFYESVNHDPRLNHRFKCYVFLYRSEDELPQQVPSLIQGSRQVLNAHPGSPLVFAGYSLGGIMAREAMKEADIFERTRHLFAISVPFHGSPAFNETWVVRYLDPFLYTPLRKTWDRIFYQGFLLDKQNIVRQLAWDNFDGSMPLMMIPTPSSAKETLAKFQSKTKLVATATALAPQGISMVAMTDEIPYGEETNWVKAFKGKTISYSSYLINPYTAKFRPQADRQAQRSLKAILAKPTVTVLRSFLPYYGFSQHSIMSYTNFLLSNLPSRPLNSTRVQNLKLYRFNDGILPLSSMLYLPPRAVPYSEPVQQLVNQSDLLRVRVFPGVDHLDMGEYRKNRRLLKVGDQFHPALGKHTPIEWLLLDMATLYGQTPQNLL